MMDLQANAIAFANAQLTGIRAKPEYIKDGAPLELWMPIQVRLGTANKTQTGMVFIHGLYFAHSPERSRAGTLGLVGTSEDEYRNGKGTSPDQAWMRNPQVD